MYLRVGHPCRFACLQDWACGPLLCKYSPQKMVHEASDESGVPEVTDNKLQARMCEEKMNVRGWKLYILFRK